MKRIDLITLEALERYFNKLSNFGTSTKSDAQKLLILTFVQKLMSGTMREYIEDKDLPIFQKVISCLQGSTCLIDFQHFKDNQSLFNKDVNSFIIKELDEGQGLDEIVIHHWS